MNSIQSPFDQRIIENIKREGIPVIIFGAGIVGEALFYACRNIGIKIECFCDNNINKARSTICNTEIIHTTMLKNKYKSANFLISAADIKDVVEQLHVLGYCKWYAGSLLLRDFDAAQHRFNAPTDFVEFAIGACLLCHDRYSDPNKLFIRSVDIVITERCSLRCRDCSNLMQYYKKPVDFNIKQLTQDIDMFCTFIDEVHEFRVIGGEPFMNKEFHLVINKLIDEPKVRKIVIYTNGTILPKESQIECLRNDKVLVFITDYGALSKNIRALTQALLKNNIAFYTLKSRGWTDCAKIIRHYRDILQWKEIFKSCCAKNTITLLKGRLYRCPFSANAAGLLAVPNNENDYINIFQDSKEVVDIYEMKNKIRFFLLEKEFLETCDYCNGRPFGAPEIQPAFQADKPLEYVKIMEKNRYV